MRNCKFCGKKMPGKREGAEYCSTLCRIKSYRERKGIPEPFGNAYVHKAESMVFDESQALYGKQKKNVHCCSAMKLEILPNGDITCTSCNATWERQKTKDN